MFRLRALYWSNSCVFYKQGESSEEHMCYVKALRCILEQSVRSVCTVCVQGVYLTVRLQHSSQRSVKINSCEDEDKSKLGVEHKRREAWGAYSTLWP